MESYKEFIERKNKRFAASKNKPIGMKDIGRKGRFFFVREAWTFMPQFNLKEKVFVIERLRNNGFLGKITHDKNYKNGGIEYRVGYYIVGKIGRAKGKWVWGQFCPLIPQVDFDKLIKKAKKEKTII